MKAQLLITFETGKRSICGGIEFVARKLQLLQMWCVKKPVRSPYTEPIRIGTRDFASFFAGAIDDIRIYNRVLSATEVQKLYRL
jgi:hypothetical protein